MNMTMRTPFRTLSALLIVGTVDGYVHSQPVEEHYAADTPRITSHFASTFLGGSGIDGQVETSMALDTEGNVYVASRTQSLDFPATPGAYSTAHNGGDDDVVVAKFDADLTTLLAATYFGGSGNDGGFPGVALAVDGGGNVYVAGKTLSADFPTTPGAYDRDHHGGEDIFVSRFDANLEELLSSTLLGGTGNERYVQLTLDGSGNVCVTGCTSSSGFPTTPGAYRRVLAPGGNFGFDAFVSRFDPDLTTLLASTFIGGTSDDFVEWITADDVGNMYITGWTASSDFPTTPGAYREDSSGGFYDAFISRFDSNLTTLSASTFFGGSNWDFGYFLMLDNVGSVYMTGHTASPDLPSTPGAYDDTYNGAGVEGVDDDAFVAKFNADLTLLSASTFLGGSGWEIGSGMDLDGNGNVLVAGFTDSTDFPTTAGAFQSRYRGLGLRSGFVTRLAPDLASVGASTYLGGSGGHDMNSVALSDNGHVYVVGCTDSVDFPTTAGAYDEVYNGGVSEWAGEDRGGDIVVSRLDGLLSADCNANEIPDACDLDCGMPGGECDVTDCGGSTDGDGDGRPDECCLLVDAPQPEPGATAKNRYLSFVGGNPGLQTAIRVTLVNLPVPFDGFNYANMWVGEPATYCENSGKVTPPCPAAQPATEFVGAGLQCTPHCMDWSTVEVVHVSDDEIIPGAVYDLHAIDCDCDLEGEANYSTPLVVTTAVWGDAVRDCTTCPCGPPDGSVGIPTDVTAVLDKFKNLVPPSIPCAAIIKARADLDLNIPNRRVDISDVTLCLDAFRGFAYPAAQTPPAIGWPGPSGCP